MDWMILDGYWTKKQQTFDEDTVVSQNAPWEWRFFCDEPSGDYPLVIFQRLPGEMTHRKRRFKDDLSIEHVDLPIENGHL